MDSVNSFSERPAYDFIIIGQGLAGTVLTHTLLERGKRVLVIDEGNVSSCSKVAAGLFNPIVFKRLTKSWMIDELSPVAENFYGGLEQKLGSRLFSPRELVKLFTGDNEKQFWIKKAKEEGLKNYLSGTIEKNNFPEAIKNSAGAGKVKNAGQVDVKKMLDLSRDFFKEQGILLEERCSYTDIIVKSDSIVYKNNHAKKIIFCEGYQTTENPWFNWLPFKLTKGEIITIKLETAGFNINSLSGSLSSGWLSENSVLIKGIFIAPVGDNTYKVGATHNWEELNETPSEKGRQELIRNLDQVLNVPYKIIAQEAGIRPAVQDRRPLIGFHAEHHNLLVFNGMGTKGVMLAPYFAAHFAGVLQGKEILSKEVDILRYWPKSVVGTGN